MSDTGKTEKPLDFDPDKLDVMHERDYVFPTGRANQNTMFNVGKLDIIHSFFNHKNLFMESNPRCYKLPNMMKEIANLFRAWWLMRFGNRTTHDLGVLGVNMKRVAFRPDGSSIPAIIMGSGPTADKIMPYIKDWKGAVFCNSSQAGALVHAGCDPTYVDVCDPRIDDWEMQVPINWKKTSLITHPGMSPRYLYWWKGKKYLTRIYEPGYELYKTIWPYAYEWINTWTLPFGNQPPWAMSHANALGYSPLFMVGCDFGFPDKAGGMTRWKKTKKGWEPWPYAEVKAVDEQTGNRFLIADNGVLTCALLAHYRDQTLRLVCLDQPQVLTVRGGIVDEKQMPQIDDVEELVRNQGQGYEHLYRTKEDIRKDTEKYLATRRMFFLPFQEGHRFVGMNDWRKELRVMVDLLNNIGAGIDYDEQYKRLEELTK